MVFNFGAIAYCIIISKTVSMLSKKQLSKFKCFLYKCILKIIWIQEWSSGVVKSVTRSKRCEGSIIQQYNMIYCTIQSWDSHQWRLLSRCRRSPLFSTASQRPIVPTIWVFSHKPEALHLKSGCPSYGHKSAQETGINIESCGGSMKYYTLSNQTKQNTQR